MAHSTSFPTNGSQVRAALERRYGGGFHSPTGHGRFLAAACHVLGLPQNGRSIHRGQAVNPTHADEASFVEAVHAALPAF